MNILIVTEGSVHYLLLFLKQNLQVGIDSTATNKFTKQYQIWFWSSTKFLVEFASNIETYHLMPWRLSCQHHHVPRRILGKYFYCN